MGDKASQGHGRTRCQGGSWVTRGHAAKRGRREVKNTQRRQRRVKMEGDKEKNQEDRRKNNNNKKKLEQ